MVTKSKRNFNDNYILNSKNKDRTECIIINKVKKHINYDILFSIEGNDASDSKLVVS